MSITLTCKEMHRYFIGKDELLEEDDMRPLEVRHWEDELEHEIEAMWDKERDGDFTGADNSDR